MLKTTASRLSAALLGYAILTVLLLTLNPFRVSLPEHFHVALRTTWTDVVLNVLLFLPVGFLFRLAGGVLRRAGPIGAAISFTIEAVQLFMPARVPSVPDVLANTLGAVLGAVACDLLATRLAISAAVAGRLRLETPLMGAMYLMVPLLWANELAVRESSGRWVLTVLLGVCGSVVFSTLYRRWLNATGLRPALHAAAAATTWFLLGSAPGLSHPSSNLTIAGGVALLSAALAALPQRSPERRFELATLRRLLPFMAVYLALAALWHPLQPLGSWHGMFGFTIDPEDTSMQGVYSRLEYLLAFAVCGYLYAERHGRSELPLPWALSRVFVAAAVVGTSLEIAAGFQADGGASLVRGTMAVISACFGGTIYQLFLAHIRFLLGRSARPA